MKLGVEQCGYAAGARRLVRGLAGLAAAVVALSCPLCEAAATSPTAAAADNVSAPRAVETTVTVTTDVFRATFDAEGGTLVRAELLRHAERKEGRDTPVVLLNKSQDRTYVAQSGVLSGIAGEAGVTHLAKMSIAPGPRDLAEGRDEIELRFVSEQQAGAVIKLAKVFTFRRGDYSIGVRHEVANLSAGSIDPAVYVQLVRDGNPAGGEPRFSTAFVGPAMYSASSKYTKVKFASIEKAAAGEGSQTSNRQASKDGWVAMVQHYFVSAWLLGKSAQDDAVHGLARELFARKVGPNLYAVGMLVPLGRVAAGASSALDARLYVGPQDEERLEAAGAGFDQVKDYGVFEPLSKPLFWLLAKLHGLLGNWGWAIVALVVLLKVVFYGLNGSAYRSLAKMRVVNPKIMEMRERLKDQPQLQQREMLRIYKEEKISPAGGCLPILIQIPFFLALYWVLQSSVEMRNAPWIGWITDLSAADPFFVLPALMALTSVLQTRLNPPPADPTQATMMWLMPLVLSAMFFFLPAGLVLYWLTNNILSIAQQYQVNKAAAGAAS